MDRWAWLWRWLSVGGHTGGSSPSRRAGLRQRDLVVRVRAVEQPRDDAVLALVDGGG